MLVSLANYRNRKDHGFPVDIDNMPAEWIFYTAAQKDRVILYFHGGGYVTGTCQSHRAIVAKFVKNSGVAALLFEYRLAPEHRFPATLDDALAAYSWLLDQGMGNSNIVFVGDSAGGGLVLAALLALRDQGHASSGSSSVLFSGN